MINRKYLVMTVLMAMLIAPAALAQTGPLAAAGITPDSPFYFLDKVGEAFGRLFAFGKEAKAAKQAQQAEERLAEAQAMANVGRDDLAGEAADAYGALISDAAANLAAAAQDGKNVDAALTDLVTKATSIHLTVLAEVYEKVPEQAKPAIQRAMTQSAQGQEAALNALSGPQKKETLQLIEEQRPPVIEERLDTLRQQGVPIPTLPTNATEADATPTPGAGGPPSGVRPVTPGRPAP